MNLSDIIYLDPVRIILDDLSVGSLMLVSKGILNRLKNELIKNNIFLYITLRESNNNIIQLSEQANFLKKIIQITNINPDNLLYFINQIYEKPREFIANSLDNRVCSDINYLLNYHSDKKKYDLMAQIYGLENEYVHSNGCHHMFIEQHFGGDPGFNRKMFIEFYKCGDFIENAIIKIILPDLPNKYKYKQQWDYNFVEVELEFGGYPMNISRSNIQSEKNKLRNQKFMENQFHIIIDNTILYHIDFREIFGKGVMDQFENDMYGIPMTFMDYWTMRLYVKLGDITDLIDMPVDNNDSKDLIKLQIEDAFAVCKYIFYDRENLNYTKIRDRTDIFSQQVHWTIGKIIENPVAQTEKIYTVSPK